MASMSAGLVATASLIPAVDAWWLIAGSGLCMAVALSSVRWRRYRRTTAVMAAIPGRVENWDRPEQREEMIAGAGYQLKAKGVRSTI
ncbi:MAG: hypothetical protein HYX91_01110 [Chloroflexi bacterium]|nr:hypothetical protein [Chloroflexota bacterium]